MNAPGQVSADEEENHALPGPGGLLRNARESAGVSLRDISAQLHLDERTVDSLERDDFATLPAPTFVRGYLRGYARLLGVPVGPVLEAYDREGFRPPDLVADISEEPENAASDFPVRLVTWAVVLVLLAMVIVWWNNNNPQLGDLLGPVAVDSEPASDDTINDSARLADDNSIGAQQPAPGMTEDTQAPDALSEAVPTESSAQAPASDATNPGPASIVPGTETPTDATSRAEQVLAQAEEVLTQSRQAIEASSTPDTGTASGPAAAEEGISATGQAGAAQTDSASDQSQSTDAGSTTSPAAPGNSESNDQGSPATVGEVHLVAKFTEETWVQIVDREEKKLYYNLAKAGQTIDLRGQGPLRVILGRTRGVEVMVDGQRFDVTPYVTKGVARFSLP